MNGLKAIARSKDWARLGDSFVNLAYSMAKTKAVGRPVGERVPDRVLSKALDLSRTIDVSRMTAGEKGDVVEAILAYAWSNHLISLEEAAETLFVRVAAINFESRSCEAEGAARAFSDLLRLAVKRIREEGYDGEGTREEGD
ncbi:MAG: ribonuclease III family protein [Candidatus Methanomethyliaceae archaeon]